VIVMNITAGGGMLARGWVNTYGRNIVIIGERQQTADRSYGLDLVKSNGMVLYIWCCRREVHSIPNSLVLYICVSLTATSGPSVVVSFYRATPDFCLRRRRNTAAITVCSGSRKYRRTYLSTAMSLQSDVRCMLHFVVFNGSASSRRGTTPPPILRGETNPVNPEQNFQRLPDLRHSPHQI